MDIFEKLEKIRSEFTEESDKEIIGNWENELREMGLRVEALKPIADYIERLAVKVRDNKKQLSENSELSDQQRNLLFAEVKVYNEVLNYFLSARNYAQYLEKQIEETYKSL